MIIAHNLMAMKINNKVNINQNNSAKLMEKLSSGKQINRAADDVAGLTISGKMQAQIRGLNQGSRNSNDGISLVLTAQGGLTEIDNSLQRLRELCVEAATDTLTTDDRLQTQKEIDQLLAGINHTAKTTKFNEIPLLGIEDVSTTTTGLNTGTPVIMNVNATTGEIIMRTIGTGDTRLNHSGNTDSTGVIINGVQVRLEDSAFVKNVVSTSPTQSVMTFTHSATGVVVTQTVTITGPNNNMYKIGYSINNPTSSNVTASLAVNIDTCLGSSDNAPAIVDGVDLNRIAHQYTDDDPDPDDDNFDDDEGIPQTIVFFNANNPVMQGSFVLTGVDITVPPTKVNVGAWSTAAVGGSVFEWNWTPPPPTNTFGDSAISVRWEDVVIEPGKSFSAHFYYGSTVPGQSPVSNAPVDFTKGLIIHTGANSDQNIVITRHDVTTPNLGINFLRVDPRTEAANGIGLVDKALNKILDELGRYGTYQNRLEYAAANTDIGAENTQAAQSRIIDTNMAKRFSEFGKYQILEQSSTAMLAQANQIPQNVLELLK